MNKRRPWISVHIRMVIGWKFILAALITLDRLGLLG